MMLFQHWFTTVFKKRPKLEAGAPAPVLPLSEWYTGSYRNCAGARVIDEPAR